MKIKLNEFKMLNRQFQSGTAINEYNGEYSLVDAYSNDKGIWIKFCFPARFDMVERRDYPSTIKRPMGVPLGGSIDEAINTLQYFMNALEEMRGKTGQEDTPLMPEDDSIPF